MVTVGVAGLAHVLVAAAAILGAAPQLPAPAAGARQTCGAILTDAEVESAVGRTVAATEKAQPAPGDSRCSWTWADTESTVTVSFSDAGAITAKAADTKCCPLSSAPVVAQFFDYAIRSAVDLGADPPAALTGLGQRAVLFFEEGFLKLLVQRPDGVAQIVGANITREQLLAVGKALAAP